MIDENGKRIAKITTIRLTQDEEDLRNRIILYLDGAELSYNAIYDKGLQYYKEKMEEAIKLQKQD